MRDWFRQSVGLPAAPRRLWMEARSLLLLLAWLAALWGAVLTVGRVARDRRSVLRPVAIIAMLGVALLSRVRGPHFLQATDAILGLTVFTPLAGFLYTRQKESLERGWRLAVRLGLVLWASLLFTLAVNNIANYAHDPRYLVWVPEFALRHVLDELYAYLLVYSRPFLFSVYDPQAVTPRVWVYGVIGIEALFPGFLLGLLARLAPRRPGPGTAPRPVLSFIILMVLLLALTGVAWMRIQQGFLTGESALAALRFLTRFTVLPIFIFSLLWRWSGKRIPAAVA